MKWLLYALVALALSVIVGLLALPDPGYVLLGYGKYSVETTLLTLCGALLVAYILLRLLAGLFHVPRRIHAWNGKQHLLRDQKRLNQGFIDLIEGNPLRSEHELRRLARESGRPLITYLAAARAAQQQGAVERRDHYLELARDAVPGADIAIELSRAELQMAQGQYGPALKTLSQLHRRVPHHVQVLKQLMQIYQRTGDWQRLRDLLPELRRRSVVSDTDYQAIAVHVYREIMQQAVRERDLPALQQVWRDMPKALHSDNGLNAVYADYLLQMHADEDAEKVIRSALKRHWDPQLAYLYGNLRDGDAAKQLEIVEGWLQQHPDDDRLLLTAAKLSIRNELWGKAKSYVEASLGRHPGPEGYQLLGLLCEKTEDKALALEAYRKGVKLLAAGSTAADIPALAADTPVEGKPEAGS